MENTPMHTDKVVVWQAKSRYALVTCTSNSRGVVVEKEIAPENVNSGNTRWVNETSLYFRRRLRDLGVLLAEPYTFEEREGKAIQSSPYVGRDLDEFFRNGDARPSIIGKIISAIHGVLTQTTREVGIDARLSNFCLGPDERVYYVDTFPPLVKYQGEFIVHFPNPTDPKIVEQELKRKFDPLGILRRLRFSILAQDAGISEADIVIAVGVAMGEKFGRQVRDFFQTLPDNKPTEVALRELTLDDPDAIRELALRFMPRCWGGQAKFFSTVFDLSSNFCPLKITTEERIARLRELFVNK
jgi:hypothetical protein